MKNRYPHYINFLLGLLILLSTSIHSFSQVPPPPPPPNGGPTNGHGLGGNQGAQNAPVGNGIHIMLLLVGLYAGKKALKAKKDNSSAKE